MLQDTTLGCLSLVRRFLVISMKEVSRNTESVGFRILVHGAKWTPIRCRLSHTEQGYIYVCFTLKEELLNVKAFIKTDCKQALFLTSLFIFPLYPSIFLLFILLRTFEFSSMLADINNLNQNADLNFFPISPPACLPAPDFLYNSGSHPEIQAIFSFEKKQVMFS